MKERIKINNTLNRREIENLLDALEEWKDLIGPKELEKNEVGLNHERYVKIKKKLEKK